VALPPVTTLTGVTTFATDSFGNPILSGTNVATANTILNDAIPNVYVFADDGFFDPNDNLKDLPVNFSDPNEVDNQLSDTVET
jgi:hypothetical protein